MSKPRVTPGMWIIYSDAHWPTTDMRTFRAMLDFITRNRKGIAGVIDLGDTFDNSSIAHHNKGKPIHHVPGSFAAETRSFDRDFLSPLESALPRRAKRIIITGNHTRFESDYIDEHPELAGVIDRFAALGLKDRGWQIVPLGMSYRLGKLTCIHGDQLSGAWGSSAMPSRKAIEVYGSSVIQGHSHSPQSYCRISPVDQHEQRMGYVCPILGTTNASYMRNRPNAWANGFAIADVRKDGTFNLYTVVTTDGQFTFAGVTYGKR